jgi:hypothetical protein
MFSGFFREPVLKLLLFNIRDSDLCVVVNHSNSLIFGDGLKVYEDFKSTSDCVFLQSCIYCAHDLYAANFIKLYYSEIKITSFIREKNILSY